jgi:hypothetical protein
MLVSCSENIGDITITQKKIIEEINLAEVWSGHPVDFDIRTAYKYQYVAYYDSTRTMCIAQREIEGKDWKTIRLPSVTEWDSHNYISITRDKEGYIHISGNMHNVPLNYFRSKQPDDINEFEKLTMTGQEETSATYPVFFNDSEGNLFFQYRNGSSGNGVYYWNRYNEKNKQWGRVFNNGIFDGEGEAGAYPCNLKIGPDGYFHIVWTWRLNGNANTNHNLSHMRSKDLVHWENMKGKQLTLPIMYSNSDVYVDPIGPWNGLINMGFYPCWDNQNRLSIIFHRYNRDGISQIFVARWESDKWNIYQLSIWKDFRWDINKAGALFCDIEAPLLRPIGNNKLMCEYYHIKYGKGVWIIDEKDFRIIKDLPNKTGSDLPTALADAKPKNEGMIINRIRDNTGNYLLQWETLPINQDRSRNPPYPAPTILKVIKLSEK